jgi:MscS family membrane protein
MPRLRTLELSLLPFVLLACSHSWAQPTATPKPAGSSSSPTVEPHDSRGRQTPRGSLMGFVKYAQRGDYESAVKYLQFTTPKQEQHAEETARQLLVLINTSFHGSMPTLSNAPQGDLEDTEDPNLEVAGRFEVEDQDVQLVLARVTRNDIGPIWLISSQTLSQVPGLYQRVGSPRLAQYFPDVLMTNSLLGIPVGQWLAWFLAIPVSMLIAWLLVWFGTLVWEHFSYSPETPIQSHPLRTPVISVLGIVIDALIVFSVGMPLFYRVYYFRILQILFAASTAWLLARVTDVAYTHARRRTLRRESQSLLQLAHHANKVVIIIIVLLVITTILGFDTKTMLAGLGIGGIAFALAAQKTLENLIGGVTLVLDQSAAVGDDCVISGRVVKVKEIGLRSLRVLTKEGTEIAFPNGMLSQASIENLSRRTRFLMSTTLAFSYECSLAQLQLLIARVRELLYSHARIDPETAFFRLANFASEGYQVELSAVILS